MRLSEDFFKQDVLTVAPELVGKLLCRRLPSGEVAYLRITETEAYRGEEDKACHARSGRTNRTAILYQDGGYAYVYMIYGLHFLLNVVTGAADQPQAALIRAADAPLNGPAKLTKALGITLQQNGIYLPHHTGLWLEDDGCHPKIATAARVGIDYAEDEWRLKPWRFIAMKED